MRAATPYTCYIVYVFLAVKSIVFARTSFSAVCSAVSIHHALKIVCRFIAFNDFGGETFSFFSSFYTVLLSVLDAMFIYVRCIIPRDQQHRKPPPEVVCLRCFETYFCEIFL